MASEFTCRVRAAPPLARPRCGRTVQVAGVVSPKRLGTGKKKEDVAAYHGFTPVARIVAPKRLKMQTDGCHEIRVAHGRGTRPAPSMAVIVAPRRLKSTIIGVKARSMIVARRGDRSRH